MKWFVLVFGWVGIIANIIAGFPEPVHKIVAVSSLICSIVFLTMHYLDHQKEKYGEGRIK